MIIEIFILKGKIEMNGKVRATKFFFYNYTLIKCAGDKLGLGIEILSCVDRINLTYLQ